MMSDVSPSRRSPKDNTARILALTYTIGFLFIALLSFLFPNLRNDTLLMGLLSGQMTIFMYYFGSSIGSARKDELLRKKDMVNG